MVKCERIGCPNEYYSFSRAHAVYVKGPRGPVKQIWCESCYNAAIFHIAQEAPGKKEWLVNEDMATERGYEQLRKEAIKRRKFETGALDDQ